MSSVPVPVEPPSDDDPLLALPPAELAAAARLLALSIAHHRAKFGVVPMSFSAAQAADGGLSEPARAALDEALGHVHRAAQAAAEARAAAAAPAPAPAEEQHAVAHHEEQRRQMRISLNTAIKLSDLAGEHLCTAMLRNISWGGAAVRCDGIPGEVGGRVCLLLPAGRDRTIRIEATVLRDTRVDNGHEYGLRFDSLDPDDEERLLEVLELLMAEPDNERRRSEVRLVQRLEVEYGDAGEFRATLEDISASGLMLTVPDPLEIGQSLLIALSSADTPFALNLRARVVHQTAIEECGIDMYRVGLQFEHPSPRLRERVSAVIKELATIRPHELEDTIPPSLSATLGGSR